MGEDEKRKVEKGPLILPAPTGAIEYFRNLSEEQMQARTDKITAGRTRWNNEIIEGKGTRRNVLGIGIAEKQGLIS